MKQYTKPLRITRLEQHTNQAVTVNANGETAERATAGGFSIGTLTNTQILTNPWTEEADRFLDIAFKEWEQWLISQELRLAQLQNKYRTPYTPIEFPETKPE